VSECLLNLLTDLIAEGGGIGVLDLDELSAKLYAEGMQTTSAAPVEAAST
jgi:hypothetical protein